MRVHATLLVAVALLVAADDVKKLDGSWILVSCEDKGEKLPDKAVKESRLTMMGDKHTVKLGDVEFSGTHKLFPDKSPKQIDSDNHEGKMILGIYKLEGDEFTVCFAGPGKDRPKEFTTKSGTGEILHVWKRAKK